MDPTRFDAWTRFLGTTRPRRAVVGTLFAAAAGVDAAGAKPRRKRRRRAYRSCGRRRHCRGKLTCAGGTCCRNRHVFVKCPPDGLCTDANRCCAPPRTTPEVCCPKEKVCGDFCCGPDHTCGRCGPAPCCRCQNDNACPNGFVCDHGECVCTLPPERCGVGGVGFVVVKRP